jgi:tetratricopeptide (TPR) repeat protein
MFVDNQDYREYQLLLVKLHELIARRQNQSPEARDLRQRMEQIEPQLSEDEIARLNALSADLSMIHGREIPDPDVCARVLPEEVPSLITFAYRDRNWNEVLELLRAGAQLPSLSVDRIAYMRARAYGELGELVPAVAFMDEAARREPTNANYRALALQLLWKSRRYPEAYSRAQDYLADSTSKTRIVLMSGCIVAQQSMKPPEPLDLKTAVATAILRLKQELPQETSPNLAFAGYVALGLLSVQLDDATSAADAFRKALGVEATSDGQIASIWTLSKELELLRRGEAKTVEERSNAQQLVNFVERSWVVAAA